MRIDVIAVFPELLGAFINIGLLRRAQAKGLVEVAVHNLRDFASDRHKRIDDYPYGGGGGMILKPEPIFAAVEHVIKITPPEALKKIILLTPKGRLFNQKVACELTNIAHLILICGRYEGVDERVRLGLLATDELSIGDYILSGGEVAAMAIIEAVVRLLPGALGDEEAASKDTLSDDLLEHPHYTRPSEFRGFLVPEVLLSGDHEAIRRWRRKESLRLTLERRPELLSKAKLTQEDLSILSEIKAELSTADKGRKHRCGNYGKDKN